MSRGLLLIFVVSIIFLVSLSPLTILDVKAQEDTWTTLASMLTPRTGLTASVVEGKIYTIGGTSASNEEYNPTTNTWTTKTSIPTSRSQLASVTFQNKIYAIGGYTHDGIPLSKNEMYDPYTNKWTNKASMPTPRGQICANIIDNLIYVTGGHEVVGPNDVKVSNKTEVYNPTTNTWITKSDMPIAVSGHSSAVVDDRLYVLTSPLQIYNTKTDSWSLGSSPSIVQSSADAVVILDQSGHELIYVIGGGKSFSYLDLVQIYNPQNDAWGVGASMPTARSGLALAVVNNKIYAFGGVTFGSPMATRLSTNECYTPLEAGSPLPSPTPTETPTPALSPTPTITPTSTLESSDPEFLILVVASILIIAVCSIAILAYGIKTKRRS